MSDGTTNILSNNSSNRLASRLDRLDFIMKYLERRTKFQGLESSNSSLSGGVLDRNGCVPLDLALKEAHFKGSLIDRVASLETRLFQLCIDMESSSNTSRTSSSGTCSQTFGDISSHRSRGESSCSLPTFNNYPSYGNTRISNVHVMTTTHEIEEKSDGEEQNHPSSPHPPKQKIMKNNKPNKDGKSSKSGKKKAPPSWPHLKLLGC